ncbi:MAG: hypothetical protein HOP04_00020 [Methylophilaceae bacterium]|nr:hypothetical protein [Methylophilaceae bacterium]
MLTVGIFEVKTKLSELLRSGETIEITSHKKSVAYIYPIKQRSAAQIKRDVKAICAADLLDDTADFGDYI